MFCKYIVDQYLIDYKDVSEPKQCNYIFKVFVLYPEDYFPFFFFNSDQTLDALKI